MNLTFVGRVPLASSVRAQLHFPPVYLYHINNTAPRKKATLFNAFNPNETRKSIELRIANYTVPDADTTYVDFAFNLFASSDEGSAPGSYDHPEDADKEIHFVLIEAIIENPDLVHHFVLAGCSERFLDQYHGKVIPSALAYQCTEYLGSYVPGPNLRILSLPVDMGRLFGGGSNNTKKPSAAITVQVHFNNPNRL